MDNTTDASLIDHLAKELEIANSTIDKLNAKLKLLESKQNKIKQKTEVIQEQQTFAVSINQTITINNIAYKVLELCSYPDTEFKIRTRNFPSGSSFLVVDQVE